MRRVTRYVASGPRIVVHMTAGQFAAHQAAQRQARRRGWTGLAAFVGVAIAVIYWYVTLPVLGLAVLTAAAGRRSGLNRKRS